MQPQLGQLTTVYGLKCRIFKIHTFGTIDVEVIDEDRAYRISGLGYQWESITPPTKGETDYATEHSRRS